MKLIKHGQPFTAGKVPFSHRFWVFQNQEHVQCVIATGADGAIVGSALINIIQNNAQNQNAILKELQTTALALKSATKA